MKILFDIITNQVNVDEKKKILSHSFKMSFIKSWNPENSLDVYQLKKEWKNVINISTMEYYSAIKKLTSWNLQTYGLNYKTLPLVR